MTCSANVQSLKLLFVASLSISLHQMNNYLYLTLIYIYSAEGCINTNKSKLIENLTVLDPGIWDPGLILMFSKLSPMLYWNWTMLAIISPSTAYSLCYHIGTAQHYLVPYFIGWDHLWPNSLMTDHFKRHGQTDEKMEIE